MSDTTEKKLNEAQRQIGTLAIARPELFAGYFQVNKIAASAGSFSAAQKEPMAVAIAVSKGCEDGILCHVDAVLKHRAKEGELVEALEVAIEIGGGLAVMYGAKALKIMRALQ